MSLKKALISVLIIGAIYFFVSFLLSKLFGYNFEWKIRILTAFIFGVIILIINWISLKLRTKK